MAEKLSRTKRYEDLRNRLDEETTAAQEDKINQQTGFARLSRTQHKALAHANALNANASQPIKEMSKATNTKSPVLEDLLGEVKQYNIDQGNRITDDTQINILRQLDHKPSTSMHRNAHIMPMEEDTGSTMKMNKPQLDEDVDGVATYMPNQKLTRMNPVQAAPEVVVPVEEEKTSSFEEAKVGMDDSVQNYMIEDTDTQPVESTYTNIVLNGDDILADEKADTDHLSLFDANNASYQVEEEPEKETPPKRTKTKKTKKSKTRKNSDSQEMPSAKIRMSTRDIEDMENEPKSKSGMIINVILVVLVLLLIASLAATVYFITQIGA